MILMIFSIKGADHRKISLKIFSLEHEKIDSSMLKLLLLVIFSWLLATLLKYKILLQEQMIFVFSLIIIRHSAASNGNFSN